MEDNNGVLVLANYLYTVLRKICMTWFSFTTKSRIFGLIFAISIAKLGMQNIDTDPA
jgi:hypothetical protein